MQYNEPYFAHSSFHVCFFSIKDRLNALREIHDDWNDRDSSIINRQVMHHPRHRYQASSIKHHRRHRRRH